MMRLSGRLDRWLPTLWRFIMSRRFTVLSAMTLSLLITFAWTSLAVADDPKDEAIKKDRQRIEGTWRIVGLSINGNPAKEGDISK